MKSVVDLLALLVRRYSVAIWFVNLGCGETSPCSSVRLCSGAKLKSTGVPCSMKAVAADKRIRGQAVLMTDAYRRQGNGDGGVLQDLPSSVARMCSASSTILAGLGSVSASAIAGWRMAAAQL